MDDLVAATIAQNILYFTGLKTRNTGGIGARIGGQAAAQFRAVAPAGAIGRSFTTRTSSGERSSIGI